MKDFQLPSETVRHYEAGAEKGRLESGGGLLELIRTKEIITRYLGERRADILDVGGGPGVYAKWLALIGHNVHLIDAVPSNVQEARKNARSPTGDLFSAELGDARHLDFPASSFDAVLMFGPLYHLTKAPDRIQALREARRVLRPQGLLFAAAISRYASLFDGLKYGFLDDPAFERIVSRDLNEGQHRNPTGGKDYFTTAFFHHPHELAQEVRKSGYNLRGVYGIEGLAGILNNQDLNKRLGDKKTRRRMLRFLGTIEQEPTLLGVSSHLLAVGTSNKPADSRTNAPH